MPESETLSLTDQHFGFLRSLAFDGPELKREQRERYPYVEYRSGRLEVRVEYWFEWPELILIQHDLDAFPPFKSIYVKPTLSQYPTLNRVPVGSILENASFSAACRIGERAVGGSSRAWSAISKGL